MMPDVLALYVCTQRFARCSLFIRNNQLPGVTCFQTLIINGNENRKEFDRRAKLFHEIVLLQTMHSLHGTMDVFAVPEQTARNSKVGYVPIWTEYRTHKNKRILEKADFSLFGVSAPLLDAVIAPTNK